MIAALFSREPLLAHWTQTFMGSAAGFLAQFFPLFLLGALFGKLMEDSGSVAAIANFMTERLGPQRAMLAVVLAGALVTYGGVSLFVAFFVLAPMAQELFRAAGIPRRLMPAAIVLGTSTFTMSALPGTPSIQNAIPMPFFGTTPFAAPGLGILASLIMLGFGLWWLNRAGGDRKEERRKLWRRRADAVRPPRRRRKRCANAPPPRANSIRRRSCTARSTDVPPPAVLAALPLVVVIVVNLAMSLFDPAGTRHSLSRRSPLGRDVACRRRRRVGGDHGACLRDRRPCSRSTIGDCRRCARPWTPAPTPRYCRR